MASFVLNIEIGEQLTKVCCMSDKKKNADAKIAFLFETPKGCAQDGQILDVDVLAEALREALIKNSTNKIDLLKVKSVTFVLASSKVATREVKMPFLKERMMERAIAINADEYFPVDLTKYHITHKLLEYNPKVDPLCTVLAMAVPLATLEPYFALAALLSLEIIAIDSLGNSHYQLINHKKLQDVNVFVDVDCNNTLLTFMHNNKLVMQRLLTQGGGEMIERFRQDYNEDGAFIDSLQMLSKLEGVFDNDNTDESLPTEINELIEGKGESDSGKATKIAASVELNRLVLGIVRGIDHFGSSKWELHELPHQIILSGTCSRLPGLKDLLMEESEITVQYSTPSSGHIEFSDYYLGCLGATVAPVNFIPKLFLARRRNKNVEEKSTLGLTLFVCSLVLSIAWGGYAYFNYAVSIQELDDLNKKIVKIEYAEGVYNEYMLHQESVESLAVLHGMTISPNNLLVAFYEELELKMPTEITVLSASCSVESVLMNITVPTMEEAGKVISQFRTFQSIADVSVIGIAEVENEIGVGGVSFSITCTYGVNPYTSGLNPNQYALTLPEEVQ